MKFIYLVIKNKMETAYAIEDLQKLLSFCIYEMYEKENRDFDCKYYLEYIRDKLGDLSVNLKENATH